MEQIGLPALRVQRGTAEVSRLTRRTELARRARRDGSGLPLLTEPADKLTDLVTWRPTESLPWRLRRQLTAAERGDLEVRAAALEEALEAFDDDDVPAVESDLGAMFNGIRSMRQQGADVAYTVEITRTMLR